VGQEEYRRIDRLVAKGADVGVLKAALEGHEPDERAELCRYAWGLLDPRHHDAEQEAALWLYAWALESERRARREATAALEPVGA
jgi:hypothetical protein